VSFNDINDGFNAAISLLKLRNRPSMLEFMDKSSIESVKSIFKSDIIKITGNFLFIIEADGSKEEVDKSIGEYKDILERFSPVFLFASKKSEDKKAIMDARKAISPSLRKYGDLKINNDIAVPINKIRYACFSRRNFEKIQNSRYKLRAFRRRQHSRKYYAR
jgi:FAD linked oxidases, C-terminal domain.